MSHPPFILIVTKEKEIEMTELEMTIATELGIYANDSLDGEAFWNEVARLLTFGDDFEEEMYNQTY
jgi:hypothetical protein